MNDLNWDTTFCELFERCAKLHRAGDTRAEKWFNDADKAFLTSIRFKDEAEALTIANGVAYGLTGYV